MQSEARPYKVWSGNREVKKSVTATNLSQLIEKGCAKLNLHVSPSLRVVLEEDGTEVDDEDYLAFLHTNSTLMFLTADEKWRPKGHEELTYDEPDHGDVAGTPNDRVITLARTLKIDISRVVTFSSDELQDLVSCDTLHLAQLLGETERFARSIQDGCQHHLDDRQQATEAVDLLRLYHNSQQVSPYVDDTSESKKRKVNESL